MELPRRRSIRRGLYRALVTCALLVGLFYLVPVEPEGTMPVRLVRALLTGLGAIVLAVSIAQLVGRLRRDEAGSRPANLLVALFLGLIVFALLDYQVAVWRSEVVFRRDRSSQGRQLSIRGSCLAGVAVTVMMSYLRKVALGVASGS